MADTEVFFAIFQFIKFIKMNTFFVRLRLLLLLTFESANPKPRALPLCVFLPAGPLCTSSPPSSYSWSIGHGRQSLCSRTRPGPAWAQTPAWPTLRPETSLRVSWCGTSPCSRPSPGLCFVKAGPFLATEMMTETVGIWIENWEKSRYFWLSGLESTVCIGSFI